MSNASKMSIQLELSIVYFVSTDGEMLASFAHIANWAISDIMTTYNKLATFVANDRHFPLRYRVTMNLNSPPDLSKI